MAVTVDNETWDDSCLVTWGLAEPSDRVDCVNNKGG